MNGGGIEGGDPGAGATGVEGEIAVFEDDAAGEYEFHRLGGHHGEEKQGEKEDRAFHQYSPPCGGVPVSTCSGLAAGSLLPSACTPLLRSM